MTKPLSSNEKSKVAVMFIGNAGAGKSALLNQIGGSFECGLSFMEGYTKDVSEQIVDLDGKQVTLIDVPGLYSPNENEIEANSKKLTEALKRGYHYKLFFVLTGTNRGMSTEDLALLHRVSHSIRSAQGALIEFRIIINQIQSEDVYEMIERHFDNREILSRRLQFEGRSFDVPIKHVLLLLFDKEAMREKTYASLIKEQVKNQDSVEVNVSNIKATNKDFMKFALVGGLCGGVVVGAIFAWPVALSIFGGVTRVSVVAAARTAAVAAARTAAGVVAADVVVALHVNIPLSSYSIHQQSELYWMDALVVDYSRSSPSSEESKVAVIFLGNIGSGKSTLLAQIGGSFNSGLSFLVGYTKDVAEQTIQLEGQEVILIDTPGLYEPDRKATIANAKELSKALKRGYDYKIFFVVMASNRALTYADLSLMFLVNDAIRQVNDAKVAFRIIVNQIRDDEMYKMYDEHLAKDNCRSFFGSFKFEGRPFDIQINDVLLLRYNEEAVQRKEFASLIIEHVRAHVQVKVKFQRRLSVLLLQYFGKDNILGT
ncbi:hypothetical protein BGZ65_000913 [Modicella reniformis]|uniref:G domain-containing protein n=1 Tax=Modicella reniformis TaxID=1440133 RepID=A0A9P6MJA9_9FUNG|nr:hypothetical protein BGZ65_000913 [Modicella reniformis]